jgi:hypothetical protein
LTGDVDGRRDVGKLRAQLDHFEGLADCDVMGQDEMAMVDGSLAMADGSVTMVATPLSKNLALLGSTKSKHPYEQLGR